MPNYDDDDDVDQVGIPLLDREASSQDPILRNRRARPSSPLRLVLATTLLVLLGFAAFHGWTQGRPAVNKFRKMWNPHMKQLHLSNGSVAAETELVRALFGPQKELGVDRFDLVASVWLKEREDSYTDHGPRFHKQQNATNATTTTLEARATSSAVVSASLSRNGSVINLSGDDGEGWTPPPEPEWQRLFSEPVLRRLKVSQSAFKVVKVVLPGRVIRSLRTQYYSTELRATFHLIPSESTLPFFASNVTHYRGSSKEEDRYGRFGRLRETMPLPYPAVGRNASEQKEHDQPWESRIPGSKGINLVRQIVPLWSVQEERLNEDNDDGDDVEADDEAAENEDKVKEETDPWREDNESGRPRQRSMLVKRSMVTLINETPVYSLKKFKRKMRKLKKIDEECDRGKRFWETCTRTFVNRGHFEQLMQMATLAEGDTASPSEVVGYRYPPFLHSNYGRIGPKDYTNLTEPDEDLESPDVAEEPDFEFDWHVSFAPISSVKAALVRISVPDWPAEVYHQTYGSRDFEQFGDDYTFFEKAGQDSGPWQDQAELLSAIMGHSFTPGARPILRLLFSSLAGLAGLASTALTAYFWYSRVLTTGIAVPAHAIDTLVRFVAFGAGVVQKGNKRDWVISPVVLLMSCLVWSLCARLEWIGGGPKDLVLVGVRRRRATKGERASTREEEKFPWWMKAALAAVTFFLATFALPLIPAIVSASSALRPSSPAAFALLRPIVQASSVVLFWSQFILNRGLQRFGASFRIVAHLDLASAVLLNLPVVLSGWWGVWETMPDLGLVDLVWFVGKAALAWQAWRYPRVEQKEDEEE